MADVKIVDIDGEQWNMKDQEARTKIAVLEEKTTTKVTNKINQSNFKMDLVEINDEKFLQLHFTGFPWSGTIGEIIATFVQDFGLDTIVRCLVALDFSDNSGRISGGLDILEDGTIHVYPHTENQFSGSIKPCVIYGDAFIRVAH